MGVIVLKCLEAPMATDGWFWIIEQRWAPKTQDVHWVWPIGHYLGEIWFNVAIQDMARFSAAPKQGHNCRMLRVVGYLKLPEVWNNYWYYGKGVEPNTGSLCDLGRTIPWSKRGDQRTGSPASIVCLDANHAHDQVTRRSVAGILLFVNNTPVNWYSKQQHTVENIYIWHSARWPPSTQ